MDKRERVKKFLNCEKVDRVPVSFWHHFVPGPDHHTALEKEDVYQAVLNGQKKYYEDFKPDFVKIMSDGFFGHPEVCKRTIMTPEHLADIQSVGADSEWISKQVEYVKEICDFIGDDVYKFYNIFSPLQYIRLRFEEFDKDPAKFPKLFYESPEKMVQAAKNIAADVDILLKELFEKTNIDGVYYSVQSVQDDDFGLELHEKWVKPWDLLTLKEINKYTENIILHICGDCRYTNDLTWYKDYPVKAFNWAVYSENVSLKEGKEIFKGSPVIGGFDNNAKSILYNGSEEEIVNRTNEILDEAGTIGVAIGADCTVLPSIKPSVFRLIEKTAKDYMK